jgi:hypothetical protein
VRRATRSMSAAILLQIPRLLKSARSMRGRATRRTGFARPGVHHQTGKITISSLGIIGDITRGTILEERMTDTKNMKITVMRIASVTLENC